MDRIDPRKTNSAAPFLDWTCYVARTRCPSSGGPRQGDGRRGHGGRAAAVLAALRAGAAAGESPCCSEVACFCDVVSVRGGRMHEASLHSVSCMLGSETGTSDDECTEKTCLTKESRLYASTAAIGSFLALRRDYTTPGAKSTIYVKTLWISTRVPFVRTCTCLISAFLSIRITLSGGRGE